MARAGATRSAAEFLPAKRDLPTLRQAAAACTGCDLYRNATQTVFGEGAQNASLMLIGEQPGDQEDRAGRPFVGPAGRLLARALAEAGIPEGEVYITNAVKHFKWERQGNRRIHQRPRDSEIKACNPWLVAEIRAVGPQVVVCLGATAAKAVFGRTVRIKDYRGAFTATPVAPTVFVTTHPSALLRLPDEAQRESGYERFVDDLRAVRSRMTEASPRG